MSKRPAIARRAAVALAAAVVVVTPLSASPAQSLKEIRAREAAEQALEREVAFTRSVCGNSLAGAIDWRSAAEWPDHASLVESCDGALGAMEAMCRDPDGRAKAKQIKRFTCAGDGAGASLSGGALRYGATPGANGFDETKALLDEAF